MSQNSLLFSTLTLMNSSRRAEFVKCLDAKFSKYVFVDEYGKNGNNHHIHLMFETADKRTSNHTTFFKSKLYTDLDLTQKKYQKLIITKAVPDKGTLCNTYFLKEANAQLTMKGFTLEEIKSWPAKELIGKPIQFKTLSAPMATQKVYALAKASVLKIGHDEPMTLRDFHIFLHKILIQDHLTHSHFSEKQLNNILNEVNSLLGHVFYVVEKTIDPSWTWEQEKKFKAEQDERFKLVQSPAAASAAAVSINLPNLDLAEIIN